MNTLTIFSEKEHQYDLYQARQEYIRIQSTIQEEQAIIQQELEIAKQQLKLELERAKTESQRADAALLEIEQLKAMLAQATKH